MDRQTFLVESDMWKELLLPNHVQLALLDRDCCQPSFAGCLIIWVSPNLHLYFSRAREHWDEQLNEESQESNLLRSQDWEGMGTNRSEHDLCIPGLRQTEQFCSSQFCPSTLWITLRNCLAQWMFQKVTQSCLELLGDGESLWQVWLKALCRPRCSKCVYQPWCSLPSYNFNSLMYLSLPGNIEDSRDNNLPLTIQQRGLAAAW